jgi:hypothetical protein
MGQLDSTGFSLYIQPPPPAASCPASRKSAMTARSSCGVAICRSTALRGRFPSRKGGIILEESTKNVKWKYSKATADPGFSYLFVCTRKVQTVWGIGLEAKRIRRFLPNSPGGRNPSTRFVEFRSVRPRLGWRGARPTSPPRPRAPPTSCRTPSSTSPPPAPPP